ncbi:hypothetical protein [Bradyrhizobium sp. CCBAU 11386]|uniref:hypothetical protein n=1 Tax=Bradyrhizobium sp. CCBAU 11386 TaxID=1630837 RepID=UPI002303A6E6|nr:hypothetical protein [Bradyrhizobium sp. CCBAU 11386]
MTNADLIVIVSHNRRCKRNATCKGRLGARMVSSVNGAFSISAVNFSSDRNRVAAHSRGTLGCVIDAGLTDIKLDRRTSQIFL